MKQLARKKPKSDTAAPFGGTRFLTAKQVMPVLGYTDVGAFWSAVRAAGIPFVRFNARKILFEEKAVEAWIASRTVGGRVG